MIFFKVVGTDILKVDLRANSDGKIFKNAECVFEYVRSEPEGGVECFNQELLPMRLNILVYQLSALRAVQTFSGVVQQ